MSIYSCNIKTHDLGFDELLESIFLPPPGVEAFSVQKVVKMLEEAAVGWQESRWTLQEAELPACAASECRCATCDGDAVHENGAVLLTSAGCRREFSVRLNRFAERTSWL